MLRSVASILLLAGFMAGITVGTAPAVAQDQNQQPAAEGDGNIVVTGKAEGPPSSGEVAAQARAITHATSGLRSVPLALVQEPLCPGVMGLKEAGAVAVIDRIRATADRLDIPLAGSDGCRPNLVIVIADGGQMSLERLADQSPHLFASLTVSERRELMADPGPVHAWHITEMRSRDGMQMGGRQGLVEPPVVSMWMAHSKIYIPVRTDIVASFILIDRRAVQGKTLVQLADYVTMRGLAQTRPPEATTAMDTILTLFDGDGPHAAALTAFDTAYLAALYDSIPNLPGISKLLGVSRQLRLQEAAEEE